MKEIGNSKSLSFRGVAMIATSIGAVAVGAFAIGALAIGRLAVRRVVVENAKFKSIEEIAREMDTAEAVQAANRHAADHLLACPICRTPSPSPRMPSLPNRL